MAQRKSVRRRLRMRVLVWSDALAYVVAVVALVTLLAVVVGVATGGSLVRAKVLLFLGGVGLMTYATARLWPTETGDSDAPEESTDDAIGNPASASPGRTRFQRLVGSLPPMRWVEGPPQNERVSAPGKLFWSSVATLLVSYLMEAVFGIA